jgi:hypothetical protein
MTVEDLILAAARTATIIASGEDLSTEEKDDALVALNLIVGTWSALGVPLYELKKQSVTMTGAASYALSTRPVKIKSANVLSAAGISRGANLVDATVWAQVLDKTRTGLFAEDLFCDYQFPTANVYLTPKPGAGTLELWQFEPLAEFDELTDVLALPPGYERALMYALALDLCPQFGRPVTPEVQAGANEATSAIARANAAAVGDPAPQATQAA